MHWFQFDVKANCLMLNPVFCLKIWKSLMTFDMNTSSCYRKCKRGKIWFFIHYLLGAIDIIRRKGFLFYHINFFIHFHDIFNINWGKKGKLCIFIVFKRCGMNDENKILCTPQTLKISHEVKFIWMGICPLSMHNRRFVKRIFMENSCKLRIDLKFDSINSTDRTFDHWKYK